MLKKIIGRVANGVSKTKKFIATASMAVAALALSAVPTFAANPDLDAVTDNLVTGAGDMKTNALTVIGVCITIFIVIFGIGWLISIFKKKMSKAG